MPANKKAEKVATLPASDTAFVEKHSTVSDPLKGWFDLAKPSRERQQKRGWQKGGRK
jgi:hypothetical protein